MPSIDRDAIRDEILDLMRSGMPDPVIEGFMRAKARDLADRHAESQWDDLRAMVDRIGEQVHGGDPVRKRRVDHFNDVLMTELRKKQENRP